MNGGLPLSTVPAPTTRWKAVMTGDYCYTLSPRQRAGTCAGGGLQLADACAVDVSPTSIPSRSFTRASESGDGALPVRRTNAAILRGDQSSLFAGTPDWWIRRVHTDAPSLTTLLLTGSVKDQPPPCRPTTIRTTASFLSPRRWSAGPCCGDKGAGRSGSSPMGPGRDPAGGMGLGSTDAAGVVSRRRCNRRPDLRPGRSDPDRR